MRETPRSRETANGAGSAPPQHRPGRALAHITGAFGPGALRRSDGRPPQTPRGVRHTGRPGRFGTPPPVPERPASLSRLPLFPALCALLLALVTWQVAAGGPLRALGERIGRGLDRSGPADTPPAGDPVSARAEFFADLGHAHIALPVLAAAAVGAVLLGRRASSVSEAPGAAARERGAYRWWLPPLAAALAAAAVPALVVPLKAWTARPGPDGLPPADGGGFYPSGHAATAAVAYGAAALLLWPYLRRAARRALAVGVPLLNAAVGAGLVVRGYHWPLDVLGSWLLCALPLWALSGPLGGRCRRRPRAGPAPAAPGR